MQTADIAAVIDAAPAGPKALVGDFNARPTAVEMVPIFLRFLDAWREAGAPTSRTACIWGSYDCATCHTRRVAASQGQRPMLRAH